MSILKRLCFLVVLLLASAVSGKADTILLGTVSFDPATNLYTYSYTIDNTNGPAPITGVRVRVDALPLSHSEPAGWLYATNGVAIAGPPVNVMGRVVTWDSGNGSEIDGVPVGSILGGFSFTTPIAPLTTGQNNFFLVGLEFSGGPPEFPRIVTFGNVVGPGQVVPEPATLLLLGTGLAGLAAGTKRMRRRK